MTDTPPKAARADGDGEYRLTLFVAGDEANSRAARANLSSFCEAELQGHCGISVVDVLVDFARAARRGIVVTPTLLIRRGDTERRVIGNLGDRDKLASAMGLEKDRHER